MNDEIIEASTLGWRPGYFPQQFDRAGKSWLRVKWERRNGNEELVAVHYLNEDGSRLVVLND